MIASRVDAAAKGRVFIGGRRTLEVDEDDSITNEQVNYRSRK